MARTPTLLAVLLPLLAGSALGQRVQFPTKLPPSTPIRVASGPVVAPPAALTDDRKAQAAPAPPESYASPRSDSLPDNAYAPTDPSRVSTEPRRVFSQGAEVYVESPGMVAADSCYPCMPAMTCCPPTVCPDYRWQFFGDFLWLDARDAEVSYAVPINGAIVPPDGAAPVQSGSVGVVDPGRGPGFRVGLSGAIGYPARLGASYTHFESDASHAISVTAPDVLKALVVHPGFEAGDTNYLDATATHAIDFDLIDLDYRSALYCDQHLLLEYLVGLRYASLGQSFHADLGNGIRTAQVTTGVDFDGIGVRLGLEGERHFDRLGLMAYGRAAASLLYGTFQADYLQTDSFVGTVASTGWEAGRVVPTLDMELGLGWTGPKDYFRLTVGYMFSAWCNVVMTDEFIDAVRSNQFLAMGDTLTFDGIVGRAELRF
ncbi:MAG: hypothetical protein HQ582_14160 [Planctomycetes bacterium]|nr:hypothetical protein [Planctomycetota bacterium]